MDFLFQTQHLNGKIRCKCGSYFAFWTLSQTTTTLKGTERRQRRIAEPAGQRVQGRLRLTDVIIILPSLFSFSFPVSFCAQERLQ